VTTETTYRLVGNREAVKMPVVPESHVHAVGCRTGGHSALGIFTGSGLAHRLQPGSGQVRGSFLRARNPTYDRFTPGLIVRQLRQNVVHTLLGRTGDADEHDLAGSGHFRGLTESRQTVEDSDVGRSIRVATDHDLLARDDCGEVRRRGAVGHPRVDTGEACDGHISGTVGQHGESLFAPLDQHDGVCTVNEAQHRELGRVAGTLRRTNILRVIYRHRGLYLASLSPVDLTHRVHQRRELVGEFPQPAHWLRQL